MGYVIIKPDPTEDFYLYWSTYTDSWVMAGTRVELEGEYGTDVNPHRFERTDRTGTSSFLRSGGYQTEISFQNLGTVKYTDLKELVNIMYAEYQKTDKEMPGDDPRLAHLITPFED